MVSVGNLKNKKLDNFKPALVVGFRSRKNNSLVFVRRVYRSSQSLLLNSNLLNNNKLKNNSTIYFQQTAASAVKDRQKSTKSSRTKFTNKKLAYTCFKKVTKFFKTTKKFDDTIEINSNRFLVKSSSNGYNYLFYNYKKLVRRFFFNNFYKRVKEKYFARNRSLKYPSIYYLLDKVLPRKNIRTSLFLNNTLIADLKNSLLKKKITKIKQSRVKRRSLMPLFSDKKNKKRPATLSLLLNRKNSLITYIRKRRKFHLFKRKEFPDRISGIKKEFLVQPFLLPKKKQLYNTSYFNNLILVNQSSTNNIDDLYDYMLETFRVMFSVNKGKTNKKSYKQKKFKYLKYDYFNRLNNNYNFSKLKLSTKNFNYIFDNKKSSIIKEFSLKRELKLRTLGLQYLITRTKNYKQKKFEKLFWRNFLNLLLKNYNLPFFTEVKKFRQKKRHHRRRRRLSPNLINFKLLTKKVKNKKRLKQPLLVKLILNFSLSHNGLRKKKQRRL